MKGIFVSTVQKKEGMDTCLPTCIDHDLCSVSQLILVSITASDVRRFA